MGVETLYREVVGLRGAAALIGPEPIAYWTRESQDPQSFMLAGAHTGWGWCWCQPRVTFHRDLRGVSVAQVTHRRVADMSDEAYDELGRAGWDTMDDGSVYPDLQEPA